LEALCLCVPAGSGGSPSRVCPAPTAVVYRGFPCGGLLVLLPQPNGLLPVCATVPRRMAGGRPYPAIGGSADLGAVRQ